MYVLFQKQRIVSLFKKTLKGRIRPLCLIQITLVSMTFIFTILVFCILVTGCNFVKPPQCMLDVALAVNVTEMACYQNVAHYSKMHAR